MINPASSALVEGFDELDELRAFKARMMSILRVVADDFCDDNGVPFGSDELLAWMDKATELLNQQLAYRREGEAVIRSLREDLAAAQATNAHILSVGRGFKARVEHYAPIIDALLLLDPQTLPREFAELVMKWRANTG